MTQKTGGSGLTTAEERELIIAAQKGDAGALDTLIEAHQSLVGYIARSSARHGCAVQDLMQQGQLGLLHAVRVFDPERNVRFWTYARWWVRAYIRTFVWQNRRIVPLSSNRTHRKVVMNIRKVEGRLGARSTRENIAKSLSVDEESVARVQNALSGRDMALDDPNTPHPGLPAAQETPEDEVAARHAQERRTVLLQDAMSVLDARDREIVERRFLREQPETLASLGKRLGISRERVRQLSQRALKKLRSAITDRDAAAAELVAAQ